MKAGRLLYLLIFSPIFMQAQQKEIELDPVTVTSTIFPTTVSKTGRNILVIKGEKFQDLPVHSIDELLRYLPGIEVQARGVMGAQSDFVIRGGTFQQVLVILDGMRINDPLTGHFNSYIPIAPAEIERIEVLKGASSAIYGSEAVGGVIHIITKSFASKKEIQQKSLEGKITIGDYGLISGNAGGFYSTGKTSVGGGLLTNIANGQPQRGTKGSFNLHTASVSVSHFLNDNFKIALRSGIDYRDFSAQNFYTRVVSDTATEQVRSFWNTIRTSYQKNKHHFTIDAGYKKAEDNYKFNSLSPANINKSQLWQALMQYEHIFNSTASITSGVQAINRVLKSNNRGNHEETQLASFLILNKSLTPSFQASPAIRIDWNEARGIEIIPQANVSWRISELQLRASGGKTIRDADMTERYNNYNRNPVPSGQTVGNPDLEAETSFSYEVGADWLSQKGFKVSATFFQRLHNKLIDYVPTVYNDMPRKENLLPTGNYALAKNVSEVTTSGVETDFQFTRTFSPKSNLWGNLGLVWLNTESSESEASFYISSHAKFLSNFNLHYRISAFNVSINGLYKFRNKQEASAIEAKITSDYFVVNTKAEYKFLQNKLGLYVQVDNLFDTDYSDLLGAKMPGRWLMFGASIGL